MMELYHVSTAYITFPFQDTYKDNFEKVDMFHHYVIVVVDAEFQDMDDSAALAEELSTSR